MLSLQQGGGKKLKKQDRLDVDHLLIIMPKKFHDCVARSFTQLNTVQRMGFNVLSSGLMEFVPLIQW